MIGAVFYLAMAGLAAYYFNKYLKTGGKDHLKSCSSVVFVAVFVASFGRAVEGTLYPEKAWRAYAVLFAGTALGTALLVAGYEGWKKAWALAQAALFLIFTSLIISSMPYFGKAVLVSRARGACEKAAPGCAGNLYSLDKAGRERLAPQLAALLDSPDRLTRIGALYAMAYIPEECSACVPRLAELAGTAGEDEFDAVMGLIDKMGPAAAGAAPALEARLSGAEGRERYRLEAALKVLRAPASAPAQ